jgi:hypothetical protein
MRLRRGGRAVDRAGLENRKAERSREFESHPLRHFHFEVTLPKQGQRIIDEYDPWMELTQPPSNGYFVKYSRDR